MAQATLPDGKRFLWIGWFGLVAALLGTGFWGYRQWSGVESSSVSVQVSTVSQGTVEDPITQTGIVQLGQQRTLESLSEGRVQEIYVQKGDRITTGQVLLLLQDDTWETERLRHGLDVQKQEIALTQQRQVIATAEAQLEDAKAKLADDEALFEQDYIARDEVERSQQVVRNAIAEVRSAQLQLEQVLLDSRALDIKAQELQQELESKQIQSPGPAVILDLMVQKGSVVETGSKLMVLGDPSRELVYLELSPLRAQQVRPLQTVRVQPLGPEASTYTGQVKEIALLAGSGEGDDSRNSQGDLEVIVALDVPSGTLIPGTQVSVDIILDQRTDVVKVDAGAIQQSEEGPFVWVVEDDTTAQKQPVSVGLEGLTEVEIIDGLDDGDTIVVLTDGLIEEGMALDVN